MRNTKNSANKEHSKQPLIYMTINAAENEAEKCLIIRNTLYRTIMMKDGRE